MKCVRYGFIPFPDQHAGCCMSDEKGYNLEERTFVFAKDVLLFCRSIRETTVTRPLVAQVVRSSSSVGANYCEANNASSRKDFRNKIFICKKEAQETKYWLRLLQTVLPERIETLQPLTRECQEIILIFQKIITTLKENDGKRSSEAGD